MVKSAAFIASATFACAVSLAAMPQQQKPDTTQPPSTQTPAKKGGSTGSTTTPGSTTPTGTTSTGAAQKGSTASTAESTSMKGAMKGGAASTFITKAAEGGKAEVELGNLASSKATNPDVKSFGQMMVSDHSKANDELTSIAKTKNVTVPSDLNAKDKATRDRLDKLTGAAFDKAYMSDMVRDHQADIKEFESAAKSSDSDVKAFAEKTLPTLKHHLEEAQRISKLVASGGAGKGTASHPSMGSADKGPHDTMGTAPKSGSTGKGK